MTEWMGTTYMKRIRKIGYLFNEGVHNMFTHGFMSFAAIAVTVACLVIVGCFSSILYNLSRMVDTLQRENRVVAYIEESYDTQTAKTVETAIRRLDNIQEAKFVSREEFGERFFEQQGGSENFERMRSLLLDPYHGLQGNTKFKGYPYRCLRYAFRRTSHELLRYTQGYRQRRYL